MRSSKNKKFIRYSQNIVDVVVYTNKNKSFNKKI